MDKGRLIAENRIPGNRDKNQGTAWHLEELQFVGHAQRPNHKSESYETHSEKGQQGYTVTGLFGHWDFILQTTWRLVNADFHNEEARKQRYSIQHTCKLWALWRDLWASGRTSVNSSEDWGRKDEGRDTSSPRRGHWANADRTRSKAGRKDGAWEREAQLNTHINTYSFSKAPKTGAQIPSEPTWCLILLFLDLHRKTE